MIDYVRDRCRMDGDCWVWSLGTNIHGYPVMNTRTYGSGIVMRLVLNAPKGKRVQNVCDNRQCCNPKHWKLVNPGQIIADQYADGKRRHTGLSARKGHLARKTRKGGYAEAEQARQMVNDGKSFEEVAEHFGIVPLTAKRWATGRMWVRSPWAI